MVGGRFLRKQERPGWLETRQDGVRSGSDRKVRQGSEHAGPARPWEAIERFSMQACLCLRGFEGRNMIIFLKKYFDCNRKNQTSIWWMKKQAWRSKVREGKTTIIVDHILLICRTYECVTTSWAQIMSGTQLVQYKRRPIYYYYYCYYDYHPVCGILNVFLCSHPMAYHHLCFTNEETKTLRG